jgi:hypothetical protein
MWINKIIKKYGCIRFPSHFSSLSQNNKYESRGHPYHMSLDKISGSVSVVFFFFLSIFSFFLTSILVDLLSPSSL